MSLEIELQPRTWYGLDVIAEQARGARTLVTPFFVTEVEPLKTGNGLLRITGIAAFRFPTAEQVTILIKVTIRRSSYLAGTELKSDGSLDLVVLAVPAIAWVRSHCGTLFERWPPDRFFNWTPTPALHDPAAEYLDRMFGSDAEAILRGATADSFGVRKHPMPDRNVVRTIGRIISPLNSYLMRRGHVPRVMEDKWFVHYFPDTGEMFLRRSWTGFVCFLLRFQERGEELYLNTATINRDPEQYTSTDADHDVAVAEWVISTLVCGERGTYPVQADETSP